MTLTITVRDQNGYPVSGATVVFQGYFPIPPRWVEVGQGTCDLSGIFLLEASTVQFWRQTQPTDTFAVYAEGGGRFSNVERFTFMKSGAFIPDVITLTLSLDTVPDLPDTPWYQGVFNNLILMLGLVVVGIVAYKWNGRK